MTTQLVSPPKSLMQRILDVVEKVGNKVPHPVVIFLILIAIVLVLSHLFYLLGTGVTYEVIVPEKQESIVVTSPYSGASDIVTEITYQTIDESKAKLETRTRTVRSLLTADGIRFMYVSLIPSFMSFTALGLIIVAMIGVGVAEEAGLVGALIKKLVIISPAWALTYILAFLGIVSSIAADAGYLVLIPLAGVGFLSVGRHPLAGLALGFAAVAGAFTVNILIKPLDAVLVEFTNDAIHIVDPDKNIGLASNLWFSIASVVFLTVLIGFITDRVISPRLGKYIPPNNPDQDTEADARTLSADESRGLRYALFALLGVLVVFGFLTIPQGAPLRDPESGDLIGNTPFMNGLIAIIMIVFLCTGAAYGYGVGKMKSLTDVIKAIEKSMTGLGSLIFLFFILSQFVSYFNYTNMGSIMAVKMANVLKEMNLDALLLLIGFIIVVGIIDLLLTGAIAKWAIFAPIFVPLLMKLGVTPEAVLAAYRVADSPINAITPLNAYFALVVGFAQKYDKNAGVGTVVALMLPYVIWMFLLWTILFAVWHKLGLPWGL